jgi:hypothetical protein
METTVLMIAMLLSFMVGAYVRAPFPLWKRKVEVLPERAQSIHLDNSFPFESNVVHETREQDKQEADKIMQELLNAWRYNGTPQKEVTPRD